MNNLEYVFGFNPRLKSKIEREGYDDLDYICHDAIEVLSDLDLGRKDSIEFLKRLREVHSKAQNDDPAESLPSMVTASWEGRISKFNRVRGTIYRCQSCFRKVDLGEVQQHSQEHLYNLNGTAS